jgi:hypothetical protein
MPRVKPKYNVELILASCISRIQFRYRILPGDLSLLPGSVVAKLTLNPLVNEHIGVGPPALWADWLDYARVNHSRSIEGVHCPIAHTPTAHPYLYPCQNT